MLFYRFLYSLESLCKLQKCSDYYLWQQCVKTEKPSVELNVSLDDVDYRLLWKCCQDSSLSTEDETMDKM